MKTYHSRHVTFKELLEVGEWKIKVYTVSKSLDFGNDQFYEQVKVAIPKWLEMENSFAAEHYGVGFLILHPATEGIFSIINWWVGENMLKTHVFLSSYENPSNFTRISGDGLSVCVWEFEVINHERLSWLNNVLKKAPNPDYGAYLQDVVNKKL